LGRTAAAVSVCTNCPSPHRFTQPLLTALAQSSPIFAATIEKRSLRGSRQSIVIVLDRHFTTDKGTAITYGRVVANQKNIVPIEAGTIASINLGRPASPISIPTAGSQKPATTIRCFIDRVGPSSPCPELTASMMHQRAPLRMGTESPTKLARDRQSEKRGVFTYLTSPHSQMKGQQTPKIGAIDQKSIIQW
jgi:hypothetical protein